MTKRGTAYSTHPVDQKLLFCRGGQLKIHKIFGWEFKHLPHNLTVAHCFFFDHLIMQPVGVRMGRVDDG